MKSDRTLWSTLPVLNLIHQARSCTKSMLRTPKTWSRLQRSRAPDPLCIQAPRASSTAPKADLRGAEETYSVLLWRAAGIVRIYESECGSRYLPCGRSVWVCIDRLLVLPKANIISHMRHYAGPRRDIHTFTEQGSGCSTLPDLRYPTLGHLWYRRPGCAPGHSGSLLPRPDKGGELDVTARDAWLSEISRKGNYEMPPSLRCICTRTRGILRTQRAPITSCHPSEDGAAFPNNEDCEIYMHCSKYVLLKYLSLAPWCVVCSLRWWLNC